MGTTVANEQVKPLQFDNSLPGAIRVSSFLPAIINLVSYTYGLISRALNIARNAGEKFCGPRVDRCIEFELYQEPLVG